MKNVTPLFIVACGCLTLALLLGGHIFAGAAHQHNHAAHGSPTVNGSGSDAKHDHHHTHEHDH